MPMPMANRNSTSEKPAARRRLQIEEVILQSIFCDEGGHLTFVRHFAGSPRQLDADLLQVRAVRLRNRRRRESDFSGVYQTRRSGVYGIGLGEIRGDVSADDLIPIIQTGNFQFLLQYLCRPDIFTVRLDDPEAPGDTGVKG